jgi:sugar (pentulose or hexulose) kinase
MDYRARREAGELAAAIGAEEIYNKSGWNLSPCFDAAKIAWLRRNEPDIFKNASCFVSTLDFMNLWLTGRCVIDPMNASIRQLTDIRTGKWDADILSFLELSETRLPELMQSGMPVGSLTVNAAKELGLPSSTIVYNGSHDQYCAAIGSGVHEPGDLLLATGTSWVTLCATERLTYTESHLSPGIFPLSGHFGLMASLGGIGSALNWWKGITGKGYGEMNEAASGRINSAADLFFFPFIAGAGALRQLDEKSAIYGMTLMHDAHDITRALMEGVAFEVRLLLQELFLNDIAVNHLVMTGGAAKSRIWSEIVAYVTNNTIIHTEEPDTSALGAAMIAAVGAVAYPDLITCIKTMVRRQPLEITNEEYYAFYDEKFERYVSAAHKLSFVNR